MNPSLKQRLEALEAAKGAGLSDGFWRRCHETSFRMLAFAPQSEPTEAERAAYEQTHGTFEEYLDFQRARV